MTRVDRTSSIWSEHERRLGPRSLELGRSRLADLDLVVPGDLIAQPPKAPTRLARRTGR